MAELIPTVSFHFKKLNQDLHQTIEIGNKPLILKSSALEFLKLYLN